MIKQRLDILAERVGRMLLYRLNPAEKCRHWSSILNFLCNTTGMVKMSLPKRN